MSENYSRRNHSSKEEKKSAPNVTEHVTKGFNCLPKSPYCRRDKFCQSSWLQSPSMNFTASKNKDTSDSSANQSTVVIKEGNNKTQESSATSSSYGNATDSETETSSQAGTNTYSSSADTTTGGNTTTSSSAATADTTSGNATHWWRNQLVMPLLTKTYKRLGNPAFFL